ncbi:cysteine desulfurase [Bosea sp. F3-2]|uniref:cysteine desulfurase family protein n=1 Tax=Bosea sp. F3-2 TaxID=2599640 RepID=UPI0011EC4B39|nr:cysteine desulfurase family protein [Bosea sp. F3-2]QEL21920.1 cysteine desulfurase [Bosea sp. F3-2]
MAYLDANATTVCSPGVAAAVRSVLASGPVNPSSIHGYGARAREALEQARDDVCALIRGAFPEAVIFNSGGTEGNNAVLRGLTAATILTSNVEHPSVSAPASANGKHITVPVDTFGLLDQEALRNLLPLDGLLVTSIQWANSETGVVQPIHEIIETIRRVRPDAFIHVDAAQAIGRIPIEMSGIDALTCSGHKLHGPPGTGILVFGDPDEDRLSPLILGGGQERRHRSGTQNVAGAAGLGTAFKERAQGFEDAISVMKQMRDTFETAVCEKFQDASAHGARSPRVPNTSNIHFPGVEGIALVGRLDQEGVYCSVGAACSSGRPEPSQVLLAMGCSETEAFQSVRFSFSIMNTIDEALRAAEIVARVARELQ